MTTLVSAYFHLKQSKKSHDTYLQWMQNMLVIQNPMVLFCDQDCVDVIRQFRQRVDPHLEKTHIVLTSYKDFYSYRYMDAFEKHYEKDTEKKVGHSALLYLIWNEKAHFLKRAIEMDPFHTDSFLWVDMGCFRRPNVDYLCWPNPETVQQLPADKVWWLSVFPFTPEELACDKKENLPSFQFTNRIGATIFGGRKEVLLTWHTLYYQMLEYFLSIDRFIGKDQSIINSVYLLHREHCHLISWKYGCHDIWFYLQDYLR